MKSRHSYVLPVPAFVILLAWSLGVALPPAACAAACGDPPAALLGLWRGEADASDTLGLNNGLLHNGAGTTNGAVGFGFTFDGVNDYISIGHSAAWNLGTNDFTVQSWVSFTQVRNSIFLFHRKGSGPGGWEFGFQTNGGTGGLFFNSATNASAIFRAWSPQSNFWHHVAVARSNGTYRLYADGVQLGGAEADANPVPDVIGDLRMASLNGSGDYTLAGGLDEIAILNRALTPAEIFALSQGYRTEWLQPLCFTNSPATNVIAATYPFTFSVAAGSVALFEWRKDGVPIPDSATNNFSITNVQPADAGTYTLLMSNLYGMATSAPVTLTIVEPLSVATYAGTLYGFGTNDGPAPLATFGYPYGLARDPSGNLFVSDHFYAQVRKISPDGYVSTFAGVNYAPGTNDGPGLEARFTEPFGLACDGAGNVFVVDRSAYTIRKISPAGFVTTLAGLPNVSGNDDGVGSAARFSLPRCVATDAAGNVYVGDDTSIRRVTPGGEVTTLLNTDVWQPQSITLDAAGNIYYADANFVVRKLGTNGVLTILAGQVGLAGLLDGLGADARLGYMAGLAFDPAGNLLATDYLYKVLRRITPAGLVTTLAGTYGNTADGVGAAAGFGNPGGMALDASGRIYVADYNFYTIRRADYGVVIGHEPISQAVAPGSNVTLQVTAAGAEPLVYQWRFNGSPLAGATNATLELVDFQTAHIGSYTVVVSNELRAVTSAVARVVIPTLQLAQQGRGTVTATPSNSTYAPGQTITLTATPARYYDFAGWSDGVTTPARIVTMGLENQYTVIFTNTVPLETLVFKEWDRSYGGNGNDSAHSVRPLPDGGWLVAGGSASGLSGNKTNGNFGDYDVWVLRLDALGGKVWERVFGGSSEDFAWSLAVTPDGGCFIAASSGTAAPNGNKTSPPRGGQDFWILRLDAAGTKLWEKTYGGASDDTPRAIERTEDDGCIIVGHTTSGASANKTTPNYGVEDIWVVRLDATGNKLWEQTLGGNSSDMAFGVVPSADGFLVTGQSASGTTGNKTSGNFGGSDGWVVKLDPNGTLLWDINLGGSDTDYLRRAARTSEGGYMISGQSVSSAFGNKTSPNFGTLDFWAVKLDAAGNLVWENSAGGSSFEQANDLIAHVDGSSLLVGATSSGVSGNKTSAPLGGGDVWVVFFDYSGNKTAEQVFGGSGNEEAFSVAATGEDGFVLAGRSGSPPAGHKSSPHFGLDDYWLVKASTVVAPVGTPILFINDLAANDRTNIFNTQAPVTFTLTSSWSGPIHYTIDGSEPDFSSAQYDPQNAPQVVPPATVKAIAYLDDLYLASELYVDYSEVVSTRLEYVPLYTVTVSTPGGGTVARSPDAASYSNNSVVTLSATNLPGWTFLGWQGDVTDTNPVVVVTVNSNLTAQAIFGTTLTTNMTGLGSITRAPALALYPFGSTVRLTALPGASRYLSLWGGALSGSISPQELVITNANPVVSASFGTITGTNVSLTVQITGEGAVSYSPATNRFPSNAVVTLTAVPKPGWVFNGWTGGSNSALNPLALVMNTNKTVTATFTVAPTVTLSGPMNGTLVVLPADITVTALAGDVDGFISQVDFFAGTNLLGISTNSPFTITWSNPSPGAYSLTAKAVDNLGAATTSTNPVLITVTAVPPVITSFAPVSGPAGTLVTITGRNFDPRPSSNIVYFGGVRATVTGGTTNQLSIGIPAGPTYAPLTVTANGLTAFSSSPFSAAFTSTRVIDSGAFSPKEDLTCGGQPHAVVLGDLDGDGKLDMAVSAAAGFDAFLSVYRNTGSNSRIASEVFGPRVDLAPLGRFERGLALADMDGDGKLDIVTVVYAGIGANLFVFKNVGVPGVLDTNSFAPPVAYHAGKGPQGLAVSDIDGDGRPDIIVANTDDDSVTILRNVGQPGVFDTNSFIMAPVTLAAPDQVVSVIAVDLDRDGKTDLAVAGAGPSNIVAFRNLMTGPGINGGSFGAGVSLAGTGLSYGWQSLAAGDLDGDGRADIVQLPHLSSNSRLNILKNNSTPGSLTPGSFAPPVQINAPSTLWSVAIGDIDGDGRPDLVTTTEAAQAAMVWKNTSAQGTLNASSFASAVFFDAGATPESVAIGDIDGDGKPDLAVANSVSASVSLFWNTIPTGILPTVTFVNPTNGTVFNISGSIALQASATDADGVVTNVSFYHAGTNFIGRATSAPFNFAWNNVSAGSYSLTAVATDNSGLSATSSPLVSITVNAPNQPPLVSITSPTNGGIFPAGTNLTITVNAADPDGTVTLVEFFAGTNFLGTDAVAPYALTWSNVTVGAHALTARATDNLGAQALSAVINVVVTAQATNPPVFWWSNATPTSASVSVGEGAGTFTLLLQRSLDSTANPAVISLQSRPGSADAGDFTAPSGALNFGVGISALPVSVTIHQDLLPEGNHSFFLALDPPALGVISNSPDLEIIISDDDSATTNSFFARVAPASLPPILGALQVNLLPSSFGQWRFGWENVWRNSGSVVTGLVAGNYELEFKPVAGYVAPLSALVPVATNGLNAYSFTYSNAAGTQAGSLTVRVNPSSVATNANPAERGGWRIEGIDGLNVWRDGDTTADGLPAGSYTVFFRTPSSGNWVAPRAQIVSVEPNEVTEAFADYFVNDPAPGTPPTPLQFASQVNNSFGVRLGYAFCGQILTDLGWGSGTVVKEKVVLTAAHVVFDDHELAEVPVASVKWLFQRQAGVYEPVPLTPRGWIMESGYAAQRDVERTPGESAIGSRQRDVAALYFPEPAGRGGYSGYLVSRGAEQWLNMGLGTTLAGYPVEGPNIEPGVMHRTSEQTVSWTPLASPVFASTGIKSYPGNSGGPVLVQTTTNVNYWPAAVYLGSTTGDGSIVRAIDDVAVDLILRAEIAANTGGNFTGGEPPLAPQPNSPPRTSYGYLDVELQPADVGLSGGGYRFWRVINGVGSFGNLHPEGYARYELRGGTVVTLEFEGASGHLTPSPKTITVTNISGRTNKITGVYRAHGGMQFVNGQLRLLGTTGSVYRIDYKTNLADATWRPVRTQTFSAAPMTLTNLVPGVSNGFLRAVLLP